LDIPSLRIAIDHHMSDLNSLCHRYAMLEKLNETRAEAYLNTVAMQNRRKSFYDSKLSPKTLNPNDLVLLYDSRFQKFLGKFKM
jgi:hypothetical protein